MRTASLTQGRFSHVCDVEAHGDGVSQVAVECMEFSAGIRCLASVGEGRNSIRLWDVDNTGSYCRQPIWSSHPTDVAQGRSNLAQ